MIESIRPSEPVLRTFKELVRGKEPCPFSEKEREVLDVLIVGYDHTRDIAHELGKDTETIKKRRENIIDKVKSYIQKLPPEHEFGSDYLAVALSLSVVAGWVEAKGFVNAERALDEDEIMLVYLKANGFSKGEIVDKLRISMEVLHKRTEKLEKICGVSGAFALGAWGAWRGREAFLLKGSVEKNKVDLNA